MTQRMKSQKTKFPCRRSFDPVRVDPECLVNDRILTQRNRVQKADQKPSLIEIGLFDHAEAFALQGVCGNLAVVDHQRDGMVAVL